MKIPQRIYFSFLLFVLLINKQGLYSQHKILITGKYDHKKYHLTKEKKVFIETENYKKVKGRIAEITDHSIIINKEETALGNINNIRFKTQNGWQRAGGISLAVLGITMLPGTISFVKGYVIFPNTLSPPPPRPGIVPYGRIVVVTLMSSIATGVYYGLIHKKFFDLKYKYEMKVVREED